MQSRYLTLDATLGSIPSAMPNVTIRNASGTGLNLRESPMQNSSSLALYANGTSVQVLGLSKNWYHVQVDGKTGFMMADKFSPRLSYSSTEESASSSGSSESGSNSGNSSNKDDKTGWDGPISTHKTAKWPFEANDYQAAVNNPKASDRLHLRTEASEKAASLGKYYNGVLLTVTGKTANGWTPVAIGNLQGYMKTSYLVFSGKGTSIPRSAMPIMTVYNPNSEACADLLDGQSLNSNFLGVYPNGTSVLLMGFSDEWAHVIVDGQMGFMQGKYLK